jgi:hypothetical protein
MNRTLTWLSVVTCAAVLAALSNGCGSSTPASNGKAGHGGGTAGTSSAGAGGGSAGATAGSGGDNGNAGATAGSAGGAAGAAGGTAGAAGGAAGAAGGTAGAAGGAAGAAGGTAGAAGGTAGAGGNKDGGMDSPVDSAGNGDTKADTSADTAEVAAIPCVNGGDCTGAPDNFACSITRTCRRNQEQACFCAPNNKIACEPCDVIDAGTDAGTDAEADAGSDAGADAGDAGTALPACPANVMSGTTTCDTAGDRCAHGACTAQGRQPECICINFGAAAGSTRWFCNNAFTTVCQ